MIAACKPFGRGFDLVQHAVNPVAHAEGLGQRLQVNVRSPHLERLDDDRIDQLDQRRVGFHHRAVGRRGGLDFDVLARQVLDGLLEARIGRHAAAPLRVILAQRRLDVGFGGDAQLDLRVQQMRQAVNGVQVRRVRQRDGDTVVVLEDRHDAVLPGDVPRDRGDDVVGDLHLAEVDHFGAEMGGLGLGDIRRRGPPCWPPAGPPRPHRLLRASRRASATFSADTKPRSTRMSAR